MPNKSFIIGAKSANHVSIKVFGYEVPQHAAANELNWLCVELDVSAGAWSGRVRDAYVTTIEVKEFREQVEQLMAGQRAEAHLEPMEPHLVLKLASEPNGRVEVSGVAFDEPEGVNAIAFNWEIDLKDLKGLSKQLKDIEAAYPTR